MTLAYRPRPVDIHSAGRKARTDRRDPEPPPTASPPIRVFSQLGVRLPAELAIRLRAFSVRSGRSLNAIVAAALDRYLSHEEVGRQP